MPSKGLEVRRRKDGSIYPLSTLQPFRKPWPTDRKVPPHNPRWPKWWIEVRKCRGNWHMFVCMHCHRGTARRGRPPLRCYHCGYNVKELVCGFLVKDVKWKTRPIEWKCNNLIRPEPERAVWTVPEWVQSTMDPFVDELPGERCW